MPKIKLTKTELKNQRDALKQFLHFLPTLQLKKQQLQLEVQKCEKKLEDLIEKEQAFMAELETWLEIFSIPEINALLPEILKIKAVRTEKLNIAGIEVPSFKEIVFDEAPYDLFSTPPSLDDAIEAMKQLLSLHFEKEIMMEEIKLLKHELRITTQRVNLFEKVKIPEAKENIRIIQIYLGDEDTAGVGRAKIAKRKCTEAA